jgi:lysophospholipase L1-like esterase
VVIALGTNDTNGQWDTSASSLTTTAFELAYQNLVTFIETQYPSAQVFCMEPIPSWCMQYDGAGTGSAYTGQTYIKTVVSNMSDPRVHYLQVNSSYNTPLLTSGDFEDSTTHPTIAGDTKLANQLAQQIKTIMGW